MYVAEVTKREYRGAPLPRITGPDNIAALPQIKKLTKEKKEHFIVVLLNARHEVLGIETVHIGSLNASIVHPREAFLPAVLASAASVIFVHNHPSGDPDPSPEDITITKRLKEAGDILGIGVLDHIIIGTYGVTSLREKGVI
jgi:DNA repair protein RadC